MTAPDSLYQLVKKFEARRIVQARVDATDRRIDALVYRLYGLSEAEIRIVEG